MTDFLNIDLDDASDNLQDQQADLATAVAEPQTAEQIATARDLAAAEASAKCFECSQEFLNSGERFPGMKLYDALHMLLSIVAERPDVAWHQLSWNFLAHCNSIATLLQPILHAWDGRLTWWPNRINKEIEAAFVERDKLVDPQLPEPKVVELESIEELVEQKVSDMQIAWIYEWTNEHGQPDIGRVKRCKRGECEAPKTKKFPVKLGGPSRQPHLAAIDQCVEIFRELENDEESEET